MLLPANSAREFFFLLFLIFSFGGSSLLFSQETETLLTESSKKNDREIVRKIIERSEYTKYLSKHESELTNFSRSFLERGLKKVSNFLQEILRRNTGSLLGHNWLNTVMNFPLWETLLFFLILLLAFLIYKLITKMAPKLSSSSQQEKEEPPYLWQSLSRVPDVWQSLIKEILNYYLSSINIVLQKDMSLRYCLELLENNQRNDSFISELVEFLEKWHFSTWQPDEKIIKSWFKSIRDKADYFKTLKLESV